LIVIFTSIYFLPTFISFFFKSKTFGIFLFNLLLGWTIIGWISIFFEAFRDPGVDRFGFDSMTEDEFEELMQEKEEERKRK
jgi:hypothetical protein